MRTRWVGAFAVVAALLTAACTGGTTAGDDDDDDPHDDRHRGETGARRLHRRRHGRQQRKITLLSDLAETFKTSDAVAVDGRYVFVRRERRGRAASPR